MLLPLRSALLGALCSLALSAQSTTWTGFASRDWHDAANWSGGVPNSDLDAVIPQLTTGPTLGALDGACRSLDVGPFSEVDLPEGIRLEVTRDLTCFQFTGNGTVALVGPDPRTINMSGGAIEVSIEGPGDVSFGSFGLGPSSKVRRVEQQPGGGRLLGSLFVDEDLVLRGAGFGSSGVRVEGNVEIAPESLTVDAPSQLQVGGDYFANENFRPQSGVVTFVGEQPQTAIGSMFEVWVQPGADLSWEFESIDGSLVVEGRLRNQVQALQLNVGGSIALSGSLELFGFRSIRVAGHLVCDLRSDLQAPKATVDVAGNLALQGTGSLAGGEHRVGGDLSLADSLLGPDSRILLFGVDDHVVSGPGALPPLEVTGSGSLLFTGPWTVASLHQLAGAGAIGGGGATTPVDVTGDLVLEGSGLEEGARFRVRGDVFATPNADQDRIWILRLAGDWIGAPDYRPTRGTVDFEGTGLQTIRGSLPHVEVTNKNLQWDDPQIAGDLIIRGNLESTTTELVIPGQLAIESGGSLFLPNAERLIVNADGLGVVTEGRLEAPRAALQSKGNVMFGAGRTTLGAGPHLLERSLGMARPLDLPQDAVLEFVGSEEKSVIGELVPNLRITGPGRVNLGATRALGSVYQGPDGGPLLGLARIEGSAQMRGAGFDPGARLEIGGDCRVEPGTGIETYPDQLAVEGNWISNENYRPSGGLLRMTGTGSQTAQVDGSLHGLEIGADSNTSWIGTLRMTGTTTVDGVLRADPGTVLDYASEAELWVNEDGALSLRGTVDAPATLLAPERGRVYLGGSFDARHFVAERLPASGLEVIVNPGRIGVIRDGLLRATGNPEATKDAVMLRVFSSNPLSLRNLRFEDPFGRTEFNVRASAFASTITMWNATGNLAGPEFEDDAANRIEWVEEPDQTQLLNLQAAGLLSAIELHFETAFEVDVSRFEFSRAVSPDGPFSRPFGLRLAPRGDAEQGARYLLQDPVSPGSRYHYRLEEVDSNGDRRALGVTSATPLSDTFGDTVVVGFGSRFTDVDSALAVVPTGGTILMERGTYGPFTVDKSVRIVARESAQVTFVDFGAGPIRVEGVSEEATVLLAGLDMSATSLQILQSRGTVVLDEVQLDSQPVTSLLVEGSPRVKVQSSTLGTVALRAGSGLFMDHSRVTNSIVLIEESRMTFVDSEVDPSRIGADAGSTVQALERSSPLLEAPRAHPVGGRLSIGVVGDPGSLYWVFLAGGVDFVELDSILPIDMVLLLDPDLALRPLFVGSISPSGRDTVLSQRIDEPALIGLSAPLHILAGDGVSFRFGNLREVVFLP